MDVDYLFFFYFIDNVKNIFGFLILNKLSYYSGFGFRFGLPALLRIIIPKFMNIKQLCHVENVCKNVKNQHV